MMPETVRIRTDLYCTNVCPHKYIYEARTLYDYVYFSNSFNNLYHMTSCLGVK